MAMSFSPSIVTNGLVLCLDAVDGNSYPSSGTVWRDLSGNNFTGSLVNGPTFSSENGGTIVFDGTNDFVNCGNPTGLQLISGSVNVWFRGTQQGANYNGIVVKQLAWGLFIFQQTLRLYDWGNNLGRDTAVNVSDNKWRNVCFTFTNITGTPSNNVLLYINGSLVLTTTVKQTNQTVNLLLGYGNDTNQYLQGAIPQVQIYNRVLSAQEVLQNYNATKSRFDLT